MRSGHDQLRGNHLAMPAGAGGLACRRAGLEHANASPLAIPLHPAQVPCSENGGLASQGMPERLRMASGAPGETAATSRSAATA
jgi:hypothetical protein